MKWEKFLWLQQPPSPFLALPKGLVSPGEFPRLGKGDTARLALTEN